MTHQTTIPGCGVEAQQVGDERDRLLNVDRTPIPVVRQILRHFAGFHCLRSPGSGILDLGCGEGAWSMVAREIWPRARIVGIEVRPEAARHAERHCDRVIIGDFRSIEAGDATRGRFDLVIGNPPFAEFIDGRRVSLFPDLIRFGLAAIAPASDGAMVLLGLGDLGQRGAAGRAVFAETPPAEQWRIAGSLAFRGDGQGDLRCYSAWVWRVGKGRWPWWRTLDLPPLPAADRRWSVVPGMEGA